MVAIRTGNQRKKKNDMSAKIFAIRMVAALAAVLCFVVHFRWNVAPLVWLGTLFYIVCLAMYAKALFVALIRTKRVTADLLVVAVMVVSLIAGRPMSGALVAWFISMGLTVSFTLIERTRRKIEALTRENEKVVRVFRNEKLLELPVEQILPGDVAVVPQGEMVPVDGEIIEGASSIDESVVTGEPFAVFKQEGDRVISGSVNTGSQLKIKTTKPGNKGFLYVMAKEIAASLKVKPVLHRKADRIVQVFIPGVVLYALGVFLWAGALGGDAETGLVRMSAVLAVACPCAWALAVPAAFAAAIGGLSSSGVLVRGGTALETVGHAVNVVLDKTGTVTLAQPRVVGIESFEWPQTELLRMAASVESGFNHPIANAILKYASSQQVNPLPAERSEYLPGVGVKSVVQGHEVALGSTETLAAMGMKVPSEVNPKGRATWIGIDGQIAGVIAINDEMTDSAENLADVLHGLGIKHVVIATGDNEEAEAQRVAGRIGADRCRWGLTPGDKTDLVRELRTIGPTVMVGDGVNDAASLAASDVGISIGRNKADLAIQSSDIIVMRNDVGSLPAVIRMGKQLIRIIRLNYGWAVGFNLVGIALATTGGLSPWMAAVFHHLSSVLVVANSARLANMSGD